MSHRGYKYRIYPNQRQTELIEKTFGCVRFVYNWALDIKIKLFAETGESPSAYDLCNRLPELKKKYPWLKEVDSQALQASVISVDRSFKNMGYGAKFPKFKRKSNEQSYKCPNEPHRINFETKRLTVAKLPNIKIVIDREFTGKLKSVTIRRTPTKKYFASVLVEHNETPPEKKPITDEGTIGIDLGINSFLTDSNGKKINNQRWYRNHEERLVFLQRRVARRKKVDQPDKKDPKIIRRVDSKRKQKAKLQVAKLHEKVKNQREDFSHKLSYRMVRENQAIIIEDLNLQGMSARCKPKEEDGKFLPNGQSRKSGLNKSILDAGLGRFIEMLEYKSEWYGTTLIRIGRFEPSSKLCNICNHKNDNLKLKDRLWTCGNCKTEHDRDVNAAKNIKAIGLSNIAKQQSGTPQPEEFASVGRKTKQRKITPVIR